MPNAVRIAVLVSGDGSNLEAILAAQADGRLGSAQVVLVISSSAGSYAVERARRHHIDTVIIDRKVFMGDETFQTAILEALFKGQTDVVCLAGYLKKIGPGIVRRFRGRILNIHPALLPKFGGAGMYGRYVHEAVIAADEKESGCTVHVVDDDFDHGPILAQVKVPVLPGDSPESLAARILEQEHRLYPEVLKEFCEKWMASGVHL